MKILCQIKDLLQDLLDYLADDGNTFASMDVDATGEAVSSVSAVFTDYEFFNSTASKLYVRLYDTNSAPDISTAVPKKRYIVPANSGANLAGFRTPFAYGIWVVASTGVADGDTNSPAANDLFINIGYEAS